MNTIRLLFLCRLFCCITRADGRHAIRRKRGDFVDEDSSEKENYRLPPDIPSNPFPSGNRPFPGRSASELYPQFPFSHQVSQGLDVNPGVIAYLKGTLNIPDPSTGQVFDLNGKFTGGPSHTWFNYGHLVQPVNPLKVDRKTFDAMVDDPEFKSARATAPIVPVAQLPSGWRPVHCKPPVCNPYVHTVDVGVQVEPGDDRWFDGSIDFPLLWGPNAGKRFPLSGALYAGTQPIYLVYGHHINPIDPFPKRLSDKDDAALPPFRPFVGPGSFPSAGPALVPPPDSLPPLPPGAAATQRLSRRV